MVADGLDVVIGVAESILRLNLLYVISSSSDSSSVTSDGQVRHLSQALLCVFCSYNPFVRATLKWRSSITFCHDSRLSNIMSAKAQEHAEQSGNRLSLDEAGPPAYSQHVNDERYTDSAAGGNGGQPLPGSRGPNSENSLVRVTTPNPISNIMLGPLMAALSLTMDGELIYPTLPPSNALYHLPRQLTWRADRVYLHRSVPEKTKKNGSVVPAESQELYEIVKPPYSGLGGSGLYELVGKRASCFGSGKGSMMRTSIFQDTWEVSYQRELAIKYKKGRWRDAEGNILATLEMGTEDNGLAAEKRRRMMEIEAGVTPKMVNLLVACWTAQVWRMVQTQISKESRSRFKEALKTGSRLRSGAL